VRLLGVGGYGSVFLVRERRTGTARAVKVVPKTRVEGITDWMRVELRVLSCTRHPNVVRFQYCVQVRGVSLAADSAQCSCVCQTAVRSGARAIGVSNSIVLQRHELDQRVMPARIAYSARLHCAQLANYHYDADTLSHLLLLLLARRLLPASM
jgi:Protein kinase domain